MSTSHPVPNSAQHDKSAGSLRGVRAGRWWMVLCGALTFALRAGVAVADCPQGDRLSMLIEIQRAAAMQELWDMGADPFGADGDRLHLRVCRHIVEQLEARGVVYEVLYEDIYAAYSRYRPAPPRQVEGPLIRRDESFVDYHDLSATAAAMQRIADAHPELVAAEVIGESIEGRPLRALRISTNATIVDPDRPAMVVVGCHHAREWISVEVPLYFADYLADNYLKDGRVTRLLNYAELWIIPVINPDGYAFTWTDFPNNRFWRKNRHVNDDGTMGVDMNRNYSTGWGGEGSSGVPASDTYRGERPFSEPETEALRDLMDENAPGGRRFVSLLSYHNYSQVVLYPNGFTRQPVVNADFYDALAGQMAQRINDSHTDPEFDYTYGQTSRVLYIASGATTDWAHNALGATAIIVELRPQFASFELPPEQILPTCRENLEGFLYMAETTMIPELKALDADLDGFVDADDYCPNSPALSEVDTLGCAQSEQDIDGDGVLNPDDACRDSLPSQQVDAEGCRVATLLTLAVSTNVDAVTIEVAPPDIDAAGIGETGAVGFTREYAAETTIGLTAPQTSNGNRFLRWALDGQPQPDGELTATIITATDAAAEAIYVVPQRLEVAGFSRIPDLRDNGLAHVATYVAQVVYTDGSTQPSAVGTEWTLSDESIGLLTTDGRLAAYDVPSSVGEIEADVTAAIELAGLQFVSPAFKVTVFDSATMEPRCQDVTLAGPERIDSLADQTFDAIVLLDGDAGPRSRPSEVRWTVSWADPAKTASVPASMSVEGVLSAGWVSDAAAIIVRAAYINDNSTVCLAEQSVTISAGDPADRPTGRLLNGAGTMCGAVGMIGLLGLLLGFVMLRLTRR